MRRYFTISSIFLFLLCLVTSGAIAQTKTNEVKTNVKTNTAFLYGLVIESASMMQSKEEAKNVLASGRIRIINLGPVVNTKYLDYAPTVSADGKTLYFVSDRIGSKLKKDGVTPSMDFWAAKKNDRLDSVFSAPYNIDTTTNLGDLGVNTSMHEGVASLAADRQSLYFTGCMRPDGLGQCDIYKTSIEGDKWGRPVNLGKNVNSKWFESQPSIAPDQSRLYFTSNRPGPNSSGDRDDLDIWYCDWDQDAEEWKPAVNLEAINTSGKEVSPFIAADGVTLFFASNKHKPNYGGLDFYVTKFDPSAKTWSVPENLGKPINTEDDEQFITMPASGDIIYFSSNRTDIPGAQGKLDVYMAFVPTFFRVINTIGTVVDECTGEFIPATVTIKNPITGKSYKDSVTLNKPELQWIVTNAEYGNPKDSINFIDFEISAENAKYGTRSIVQRVNKPMKTDNPEEVKKAADEVKYKVTLGQRPTIQAEIGEAAYISKLKVKKPEMGKYRGLVMEEINTWDLYPLLNYLFFDIGSSELPKRYHLFKSPEETRMFSDTTIARGTLNKYYHILNIYGFRLNKFPTAKIEIVGCNDGTTNEEKRANLSKERAQLIYDYFLKIWKISPDRMKLTFRDKPAKVSNLKDSLGIRENRRVEILCEDWNVMKPVFDRNKTTFPEPEDMLFNIKNGIDDQIVAKRRIEIKHGVDTWKTYLDVDKSLAKVKWDWTNEDGKFPKDETPYTAQFIVQTLSGAECKSDVITIPVMQISTDKKKIETAGDSTLENYSLILFPFDSFEAGQINDKIMKDYVYDRVKGSSVVVITGHTDVVGMEDHNLKLSEKRANTVFTGIKKTTGGKYGRMDTRGVGEEEPIYSNELPEGRFYNRTVQVKIQTPVSEYEK